MPAFFHKKPKSRATRWLFEKQQIQGSRHTSHFLKRGRTTSTLFLAHFVSFFDSICCPRLEESQRLSFVNGHMIGLVTLNEVLRYILRGMVHVPLQPNVRSDLLENHPANSTSLGVPFNMFTTFECFWHIVLFRPKLNIPQIFRYEHHSHYLYRHL